MRYSRRNPSKNSQASRSSAAGKLVVFGALAAGAISLGSDGMSNPLTALNWNCNIKGNVSQNNGERIFHVPGQKYYTETRIEARWGERWFCSEAEARAAGWRKSRV